MNKLQELEALLYDIQAQIDEMKNAEEEWPRFGDKVWMLGMEGATVVSTYTDSPMWRYKLATGSLHRTEAEASAYREWLTSPCTQARRMVEMCDGFDLKGKYCIYYNRSRFRCDVVMEGSMDGGLRFSSREKAYSTIDKLGEETIKLALGIEE